MLFKTEAPKCICLRNAGLVGGVIKIERSDFYQILAFDSERKISCLLQQYKSIVPSRFSNKIKQILD